MRGVGEDDEQTILRLRSELCALVIRARVRTERSLALVPTSKREVAKSQWLAARARRPVRPTRGHGKGRVLLLRRRRPS